MSEEAVRLVGIATHIIDSVTAAVPNAYRVDTAIAACPAISKLWILGNGGRRYSRLLLELDEQGIAVSSGSPCSANHAGEPSHVLECSDSIPSGAGGSLRLTLGRFNTMDEATRFLGVLPSAVRSLRSITTSP